MIRSADQTTVIDLTLPLTEQTRIYPGDPEISVRPYIRREDAGYNVHQVSLGSHTGTHLDPPAHFLGGGARRVGGVDPSLLVGRGLLIDVRDKRAREPIILDDLQPYEDRISTGLIVVFMTAWDTKEQEPDYLDHPYVTEEVGKALIGKGVKTIGIDTINVDPTWGADFPVHMMFAEADGLIVEALANLYSIPRSDPFFVFAPLKLMEGSGAPVRALVIEFAGQDREASVADAGEKG
jgi:kynurenine formamidase